ncbi:MAG: hypothetical protein AAF990_18435 [Bacteroidota bacterium]
MKTRTSLFVSLLFCTILFCPSNAQPVINSSWQFAIGDTLESNIVYPNSLVAPAEGIGFTWDISDLAPVDFEREIAIVDPSELEYGSEFPAADLGYKNGNSEFYMKRINGNMHFWGSRSQDSKVVYGNGSPVLLYDNFQFGDVNANAYERMVIVTATSDTTITEELDSMKYAGVGTVVTPTNTYEDCVMTKLTRSSTGIFSLVEYNFYKGSMSNLVASYRRYTSGRVEPTNRVMFTRSPILTSSSDILKKSLTVEGPFQDRMVLRGSAEKSIQTAVRIIDMMGSEVLNLSHLSVHSHAEIDLHRLASRRNYVLLVINKADGAILTHKFFKP